MSEQEYILYQARLIIKLILGVGAILIFIPVIL